QNDQIEAHACVVRSQRRQARALAHQRRLGRSWRRRSRPKPNRSARSASSSSTTTNLPARDSSLPRIKLPGGRADASYMNPRGVGGWMRRTMARQLKVGSGNRVVPAFVGVLVFSPLLNWQGAPGWLQALGLVAGWFVWIRYRRQVEGRERFAEGLREVDALREARRTREDRTKLGTGNLR